MDFCEEIAIVIAIVLASTIYYLFIAVIGM